MNERKRLVFGYLAVVAGLVVMLAGSVVVHMAEAPEFDALGRELYPLVPRGWVVYTAAQTVALGGVLIAMAGVWFAHIHLRKLTWNTAMLGAVLFSGLMLIIFAVIPNQFLTLAQSTLEWTPQKIFVTIPPFLVLGNDVSISYAALKDMISAGYATTMLIAIPIIMYQIQERSKKAKKTPPPTPVSDYGRPLRVERKSPNGAAANGSGV